MDEISEFFKNAKRMKVYVPPPPEWWEDPKQKYTVIVANVPSKTRWHRTILRPDEAVICPSCSRFDHWKLGGNPRGLVMICEHAPVWAGRGGVRNIVSIPIRFIHLEDFICYNCGNKFKDCVCTENCFDEDIIDRS